MLKQYVEGQRGLNADLRELGSIYRMIIVAGLRSKQLLRGSKPRIDLDPMKRRNISIALEEVRRGLVPYILKAPPGVAEEVIHSESER